MVVFVGTPPFRRIALWVAIETMHLDIARISLFSGDKFFGHDWVSNEQFNTHGNLSWGSKVAKYHGIYNVKLHNEEMKSCKITSLAFLPNGCLLVCDQSNSTLKLLDRFFKYRSQLNLPGRPHDLCVYSSNREGSDVYVTIPSERTILEVFAVATKLTIGDTFKTEHWCYGITPFKEGLFISVGTKLKFIDINSKTIKIVNYGEIGQSPFGSPCYLDIIDEDRVLVSDSLKHALYCIDGEGTELFRYTDMYNPHDIVSVGKGMFCLTGTDSKTSDVLHQVTEDGDKVTSLLSWKSLGFSPLSLSYRPSDRLLVVGGECDRVKTFKLIPKDLKRKGWTMKSEDLINP